MAPAGAEKRRKGGPVAALPPACYATAAHPFEGLEIRTFECQECGHQLQRIIRDGPDQEPGTKWP